ncbi:MAG: hypothetical protein LBJ12_09505 [Oscillospiraceae bacterium]|jgi:formylmethanofuran dehydrogenase subunit E|nr:hypothetical protein [Oscillospiraceae bacterium]
MAMTLGEKVAHLKGLSEGLGLDENETHGRLISAIIAVLEEAASTVKALENTVAELSEQLDAVDEDLDELEDYVYEELTGEDWTIDDDGDSDVEVQCPACGETFAVDEEILDEGEIHCPVCNELLEFDVSCDCGHDHGNEE